MTTGDRVRISCNSYVHGDKLGVVVCEVDVLSSTYTSITVAAQKFLDVLLDDGVRVVVDPALVYAWGGVG